MFFKTWSSTQTFSWCWTGLSVSLLWSSDGMLLHKLAHRAGMASCGFLCVICPGVNQKLCYKNVIHTALQGGSLSYGRRRPAARMNYSPVSSLPQLWLLEHLPVSLQAAVVQTSAERQLHERLWTRPTQPVCSLSPRRPLWMNKLDVLSGIVYFAYHKEIAWMRAHSDIYITV